MQSTFKIGVKVVFTSYRDGAWGAEYGGKTAMVRNVYDYEDGDQELSIEFEDGLLLGVSPSECIMFRDDKQ